jgi:hypothetical protein
MTRRPGPFATAAEFRQALEDRLRRQSSGRSLPRLRRMIAIERLLARLFAEGPEAPWVVKGGIGLEARYRLAARGTKDLDLSVPDTALLGLRGPATLEKLHDRLQQAAARDAADHFSFVVVSSHDLGTPG